MKRLIEEHDGKYLPAGFILRDENDEPYDAISCLGQCITRPDDCSRCEVQDCFRKLYEYEETGLTPDQLREIDRDYQELAAELAHLKKQVGRFIYAKR